MRAERIRFGLRSVWMRSASDLWDVAVGGWASADRPAWMSN